MDEAKTAEQLQGLVDELQPIDSDAAGRLSRISDAVTSGDLGQIANFNLRRAFDLATIEERAWIYYRKRPRFLGVAEWARNVLVLLPILLTWLELSRATSNYRTAVERNPDLLEIPFLLLWEQGFAGAHGMFDLTFSQVSFIDAIILLIVVLLTLFIHQHRDVGEVEAEGRAMRLRQRLEKAIWDVSEAVGVEGSRQDVGVVTLGLSKAAENFHNSAHRTLAYLQDGLGRLQQIEQQRETELGRLALFSQSLEKGAQDLMRYGSTVGESVEQLGPKLQGFDSSASALSASVERLGQIVDQLAQTQAGFQREVSRMSDRQAAVQTEVSRMSSEIQTGFQKEIASLTQMQAGLQKEMSRISERNQAIATATEQSVMQLQQSSVNLMEAVRVTVQPFSESVQQLNQTMTRLEQEVARRQGGGMGLSTDTPLAFWVQLGVTLLVTVAVAVGGLVVLNTLVP